MYKNKQISIKNKIPNLKISDQMKDKLCKDDVVVVIFHDHGTRYVGKLFNDEWMKEMKFI